MGHILLSSNSLWSKECWSHFPACHDILLPWPNPHHIGILVQPYHSITKMSTTYRRLAETLFAMPQVQNSLESPKVWFLCPRNPSTQVHCIPQRNNGWPHQILGYPWSPFTTNSAPIGEPPRQGQLPSRLCTRECNKIPQIHMPTPHKNPLCLGSTTIGVVWCTQTSPGFCTITLGTRLHSRLHSLCVGLRECHC